MKMHDEVIEERVKYDAIPRWNSFQNKTQFDLKPSEEISEGLAKRLAHYARKEITQGGFEKGLEGCKVHVECIEETYTVSFYGLNGYRMGVEGILLEKGWPTMDHGLFMDRG